MTQTFQNKRTRPGGWYWTGWESMSRREVHHGENVDFICWYLYQNPGARYTEVLRALCERNGIEYTPGQYSHYFNSGFAGGGYVDSLWTRVGRGWMLTLDGMARYGEWCC